MGEPYDHGEWTEDYHSCYGEYACEVVDRLCPLEGDGFKRQRAAAAAGRFRRPRTTCPTCGQETGLADKAGGD